jgi:hypothetical protein
MVFLKAIACLLIAVLFGEMYFRSTIDTRGGWDMGILPYLVGYFVILIPALAFWAFLFTPVFMTFSSSSLFWRIYIAPLVGGLVAYLMGTAFGLMQAPMSIPDESGRGHESGYLMALTVTGFTLFTCGSVCKWIERS